MILRLIVVTLALASVIPRHTFARRNGLNGLNSDRPLCKPMTSDLCRVERYNMTDQPNSLGHRTQEEAETALKVMTPLFRTECAQDVRLFFCLIHFPMCVPVSSEKIVVQPCRSLCLSVRSGCEGLMNRFNYSWPKEFNCERFPKLGNGTACVFRNTSSTRTPPASSKSTTNLSRPKQGDTNKQIKEGCWKDRGKSRRYCRLGIKLAKMSRGSCSLRKRVPLKFSSRDKNFLKRDRKRRRREHKLCFESCCKYMKRQRKIKKHGKGKNRKRRP